MKIIRRFIESTKQVFFWLPIIWKTRDFDYGYMLEMFELKMKKMLDFLNSDNAVAEQQEKDLLALKRCVEILNIISNETYRDIVFDDHYKKYPIKPLNEWFADNPEYPSRHVMKNMEGDELKSFKEAYENSEKLHSELLSEFCNLFSTHYRNWWD